MADKETNWQEDDKGKYDDQYRALIEDMNQPILQISMDGTILFMNTYSAAGFGGEVKDYVGKKLWDLFPEDIANNYSENIKGVIAGGKKLVVCEETVLRGEHRWFESSLQPIKNEEGILDSVLIIAIDVTDRKKMEEDLKERDKQYKSLVEGSNHPIAKIDYDGKIYFVNGYAAGMLGVDADSVKGKTMWDFFPQETADRQMANIRKAIDERERKLIEGESIIQGVSYWFQTSLQPLVNEDGSVDSVLMLAIDITERKRFGDALKESEALYRTIFENTGAATMLVEEDLSISMVNHRFSDMAGCPKADIEGKTLITDFVAPGYVDKVQEYHRIRLIDPEAVPKMYEFKFKALSGELRDVYATVALIPGTRRSLASMSDITELKRKEFQIQKQKEMSDNLNLALEHKVKELEQALSHIKKLEGLVPICVGCKKMLPEEKDSKDPAAWVALETYISERSNASFTHGLCPDCIKKMYGSSVNKNHK